MDFETLSLPFRKEKNLADHALQYLAVFHHGPKKYRKAFKAFIAEACATGDFELARREHLLALDLEALRAAAIDYRLNKLKSARSR